MQRELERERERVFTMRYVRPRIKPRRSHIPHQQRAFGVKCGRQSILTTVTATPSVVRRWIYKIRYLYRRHGRDLVVGLGVQWCPGNISKPATLQLCVGRYCLVFQLFHAPRSPLVLRRFLSDADATFVGVWNYRDRALLRESKHNLNVSNLVDLRCVAAESRGYERRISMERLAALVLEMEGVEKPEWVGRSDWEKDWLSQEQVKYACLDAFISFSMGKKLEAWEWK